MSTHSLDTMTEDPFVEHRSLLFTVAYEMLGSAADAEDVVQETWLRWSGVEQDDVADPRAYLVRIVTRQSLNRSRALARRREDYVGEWLPEPVLTTPDVADDVELAESVSIAMLRVLETLGPTERAVFILREVFDLSYDEIGSAIDKSTAAVRQIAHRARNHVAARRPRMQVDRSEQEAVTKRFLAAIAGGDIEELLAVLAPDVVLTADGGGIVTAARKPIAGAAPVSKLLSRLVTFLPTAVVESAVINGGPGGRVVIDGRLDTAVGVTVVDGLITEIFAIRNPAKLGRVDEEVELGRR